jgi:hypothetical protein
MDSQDYEPKLELSLSQLPDQPFQLPQPPCNRPQDEAGSFEHKKRACIDQLWHGNLQEDSGAMVIFLQVDSIEPRGHEVIFHSHFQESNANQYRGPNPRRQSNPDYYRYVSGPVYLLSGDQRSAYIAVTIQPIF